MYTTHLLTIASGVASSLLAIGCIEVYHWIKRSLYYHHLAQVLALQSGSTVIVTSIKDKDVERKAVDYRDAYAVSHLLELCSRIGIEAKMEVFHRRSEIADERAFLSVGGPLANDFTEEVLRRFIPTLQPLPKHDQEGSPTEASSTGGKHRNYRGFSLDGQELLADDYEEPAFLIKLTPEVLSQDRTIHLIFGYSGHGTAAAAYYLSKYYRQISQKHGRKAYCISIKVQRKDVYKSVSMEHVEHSLDRIIGRVTLASTGQPATPSAR